MKYDHQKDIEVLYPLCRLIDDKFLYENEETDKLQLNGFIIDAFENLLQEKLLTNQTKIGLLKSSL